MKKLLRNLFAGAGALLAVGFAQQASASHYQASDLTYTNISPNIFVVNLKLYRDCTGASAPYSATLNIKSLSCNSGRNITMNKVGGNRIGDPYCASIPKSCSTTGRTNYEEVVFNATVTFTTTEQACPEWIMSWQECCRPNTANLIGQDNFYTEAMVRLGNTQNSSPEFSQFNIPIPFVNYNQPILLSLNATETDGDSLVYSLVDPLKGNNDPVPYKNYAGETLFNADSTKVAFLQAGTFSSTYPIISYTVDWNQPGNLATPVQKFMFDSRTGSLGFIPIKYDPNSASAAGTNKYALAVKIDEFRTINGVPTKVGSVRRDMLINVIDCGPNQNPKIAAPVANGQPITETDVINLRPGTPLTFQFAAADGNTADVLSVQTDASTILPGAIFTRSTANQPTGTISWTPTANDVRNQIYYFHVTVLDDACPVKGFQTHTFGVRVSATGGVTGTSELTTLPKFIAYPNPFSETISFKVNITRNAGQQMLIYNVLGQQVDKIELNALATGEQTIIWKNAASQANGQYIARLISNQQETQTIRFSKLQ